MWIKITTKKGTFMPWNSRQIFMRFFLLIYIYFFGSGRAYSLKPTDKWKEKKMKKSGMITSIKLSLLGSLDALSTTWLTKKLAWSSLEPPVFFCLQNACISWFFYEGLWFRDCWSVLQKLQSQKKEISSTLSSLSVFLGKDHKKYIHF